MLLPLLPTRHCILLTLHGACLNLLLTLYVARLYILPLARPPAPTGLCAYRCNLITIDVAGVCRHSIPAAAVNLKKTGERYGYAHYLLTKFFYQRSGLHVINMDIACKFKVWEQRVIAAFEATIDEDIRKSDAMYVTLITAPTSKRVAKILGELHGHLHSLYCQVQ